MSSSKDFLKLEGIWPLLLSRYGEENCHRLMAVVEATQGWQVHGNRNTWLEALEELRSLSEFLTSVDYNLPAPKAGEGPPPPALEDALQKLHPWRKGPFSLRGLKLESEWRSDMKFSRLTTAAMSRGCDFSGAWVLDVGSGNGYFGWRLLGEGAKTVCAVDSSALCLHQHLALSHFLAPQPLPFALFPLTFENWPEALSGFDVVLSLGVLYHRPDPFAHLKKLWDCLAPRGWLFLESLVVQGNSSTVFLPPDRYAAMRNVWFLPSAGALCGWLKRAGFREVELMHEGWTEPQEQRRTRFMRFHSLGDFLDANNPRLTREGHPAPRRALLMARR